MSAASDQRIARAQAGETAEVAVGGPQLVDTVVQAQGGDAGVVHRRPDVPWARLLLSGIAAFDPDLFTPVGQRHQRRFLVAFAAFFLCAVLGAATVSLAG